MERRQHTSTHVILIIRIYEPKVADTYADDSETDRAASRCPGVGGSTSTRGDGLWRPLWHYGLISSGKKSQAVSAFFKRIALRVLLI